MDRILPLICVATSLTVIWASNANFMHQDIEEKGGHLENCAGDAKHNFTLTWEPEKIKLNSWVVVNFSMIPAVDLEAGTAGLEIHVPNVPDPIYKAWTPFTCQDIDHYIDKTCPFKKGKAVNISQAVPTKTQFPIPPCDYRIYFKVQNQDGDQFICAKGTISIVGEDGTLRFND